MNEITTTEAVITEGDKHFVMAMDADGNPIKIEIQPTGEFSQEADKVAETPTIH